MPQAVIRPRRVVMSPRNIRHPCLPGMLPKRTTGNIVARGKGASRAGKHDHTDRVVHLGLDEGFNQVAFQLRRHPVQTLGLVKGNQAHAWVLHRNGETTKISCLHDVLSFIRCPVFPTPWHGSRPLPSRP